METDQEKVLNYGYIVVKVQSKTKQGPQKWEYAAMIPNNPPPPTCTIFLYRL